MLYSVTLFEATNIFYIILIIIKKSFVILILMRNIKSSIKLSRHCLILLFLLHLFHVILLWATLHVILINFWRHVILISYCMKKLFVLYGLLNLLLIKICSNEFQILVELPIFINKIILILILRCTIHNFLVFWTEVARNQWHILNSCRLRLKLWILHMNSMGQISFSIANNLIILIPLHSISYSSSSIVSDKYFIILGLSSYHTVWSYQRLRSNT